MDTEDVFDSLSVINGLPTSYINNARYLLSGLDIRVIFSQVVPISPAPQPGQLELPPATAVIRDQFCIIVPPELAKSLADLFADAVQKYEQQFGKLRAGAVPPVPVLTIPASSEQPR
jgi:Protein of unknown function (DUF3467)